MQIYIEKYNWNTCYTFIKTNKYLRQSLIDIEGNCYFELITPNTVKKIV